MDFIQLKFFIIPDYTKEESICVYKVHHSLGDGIANVLMFTHLTDKPSMNMYPNIMVRFSFIQNVVICLCLPFNMLWNAIKLIILTKVEKNGYKNPEMCKKLSVLKQAEFVPDINIADIKKRA